MEKNHKVFEIFKNLIFKLKKMKASKDEMEKNGMK